MNLNHPLIKAAIDLGPIFWTIIVIGLCSFGIGLIIGKGIEKGLHYSEEKK